jgi:hypothetical protein
MATITRTNTRVKDLATHGIKDPVYHPDRKTAPRGRDWCLRNPRAVLPEDLIPAGHDNECAS